MALFPAYATTSIDSKTTTTISDSTDQQPSNVSFRFSSFQSAPPAASTIDQQPKSIVDKPDVIDLDDESPDDDDEIVIVDEKRPSSSADRRKRRHKRKEKKEKRKRRRSSSSSSTSPPPPSKSKSTDHRSKLPIASTSGSSAKPSIVKWSLEKSIGNEFVRAAADPIVLDNRRDLENLQYTSVYKGHLAKYRSEHFRHCLGNESTRIDRLFFGGQIDQDVEKSSKWRRYYKPTKDRSFEFETIPTKTTTTTTATLPDFVPLSNKTVIDGETLVYDSKLQMYRSMGDNESAIVGEDQSVTDSSLSMENRRLNRLLAENPHDTSLWRQFLRLQDRLFDERRTLKSTNHRAKNGEMESYKISYSAHLERKLSVLEKALAKNPSNVELKLMRLRLGREIGWDLTKQRDEWRRLEFTHINDPRVWIDRLRFENGGDFSNFTVARLSNLNDHCAERFATVLAGRLITHPPPADGDAFLVDLVLGKIRFLFDAGHSEQAVGSLQALLEFNFRRPTALETVALEDRRKFFESFWDSNTARFGDDAGGGGWSETVKNRGQHESTDEQSKKETEDEPSTTIGDESAEEDRLCRAKAHLRDIGLWLELERFRESRHWHPWRSNGDDEPDDPQRIVLFDDISGIIFDVRRSTDRFRLIYESLEMFGAKLPPLWSSNHAKMWYDESSAYRALEIFDVLPRLRRVSTNFNGSDEFVRRMFRTIEKTYEDDSPVRKLFFVYARFGFETEEISKFDIPKKEKLKRYRKLAKSIMDDDRYRERFVFYSAYARGLRDLDAMDDSSTVAETALIASNGVDRSDLSPTAQLDRLSIWDLACLWTENRLFQQPGEKDSIVAKLSNWIATDSWPKKSQPTNASDVLKAKKILSNRSDEWKSNRESNEKEDDEFLSSWFGSIGCLTMHLSAMLNYTSTGNLTSSKEIYDGMRQYLKNSWEFRSSASDQSDPKFVFSSDNDLERLWSWEIRLVEHHLRTNPGSPPRLLIDCLEKALSDFPTNPKFLKMYADRHLRGQLMMKLRRFFDSMHDKWPIDRSENRHSITNGAWTPRRDFAGESNAEISWLASIYSEFSRYLKLKEAEIDDANDDIIFSNNSSIDANRLRHVLIKSVESRPNSVLLWRLRLSMESYLNGGDRDALNRVFYVAIRQCPWAKEIYEDAAALMPDQGQSIVDLMMEKGLRVRTPWEEMQLLRKAMEKEEK